MGIFESIKAQFQFQSFVNKKVYRRIKEKARNRKRIRANYNWVNDASYRKAHLLHKVLILNDIDDPKYSKARIGSKYDGGYVMVMPASRNKIAYSFGICTDVTWEGSIADYGYDLFMYDHTIDKLPYERNGFHWTKSGICGKNDQWGGDLGDLRPLDYFISKNGHDDLTGMLLKMDVEGAEWQVFETISEKTIKQFDQIVMECHDILTTERSEEIFRKICKTHVLVHIHGNNTSDISYNGDYVTPDTIEVTFLIKDYCRTRKSREVLPIRGLDCPCTYRAPEMRIGKWNV